VTHRGKFLGRRVRLRVSAQGIRTTVRREIAVVARIVAGSTAGGEKV